MIEPKVILIQPAILEELGGIEKLREWMSGKSRLEDFKMSDELKAKFPAFSKAVKEAMRNSGIADLGVIMFAPDESGAVYAFSQVQGKANAGEWRRSEVCHKETGVS